LIGRLEMAV